MMTQDLLKNQYHLLKKHHMHWKKDHLVNIWETILADRINNFWKVTKNLIMKIEEHLMKEIIALILTMQAKKNVLVQMIFIDYSILFKN